MTFPLRLALIVAALLLAFLIGLRWLPADSTVPSNAPVTVNIHWQLNQQSLANQTREIKLNQGDSLALTVVSDFDDELHIHGYDRHLPLKAGQRHQLIIDADIAGRFEAELHRRHATIGTLLVNPK